MITLKDIKNRKLNKEMWKMLHETWELGDEHNDSVTRYRMENNEIDYCIYDFTHYGNELYMNEDLLDRAKCYYKASVYTDEEWEKYFLPAINKQIKYNDNFLRFHPGYLIKNKSTNKLSIVQYDYAEAFGGTDYTDLSICEFDDNGEITMQWAWASYNDYELVDSSNVTIKTNIKKIRKYHKKYPTVPLCLCDKMRKLLY